MIEGGTTPFTPEGELTGHFVALLLLGKERGYLTPDDLMPLMESVEGYHAERIALPLKLASYEELCYTHNVVDVSQLPQPTSGQSTSTSALTRAPLTSKYSHSSGSGTPTKRTEALLTDRNRLRAASMKSSHGIRSTR